MGNAQYENPIYYSSDPNVSLLEKHFTILSTKNDPRLGTVDELQHKVTNEILLRKEIQLKDQSQFTSANLQKLRRLVTLNHQNLLKTHGFVINISNKGPSKLSLFFEQFKSDARIQFQERRQKQAFFKEEELYFSLLDIINALAYLHSNKISHGYLTPETILMAKNGDIKLLNHSLFENTSPEFKNYVGNTQNSYIAPELLTRLGTNNKQLSTDFNAYKADIFSAGLIFIHAALLGEPIACYNWNDLTFNPAKLSDLYERVRAKYSGKFANILSHMIRIDPAERPDAQSLPAKIEDIQKQSWCLQPSKSTESKFPSPVDEIVNKILSKNRVNETSYLTPPKNENRSSELNYGFLDPEVKRIIKETQEKHRDKDTAFPEYKFRSPSQERRKDLNGLASSYANSYLSPQISQRREYPSRNDLQYGLEFESPLNDGFEERKFKFNTPRVNEIISEVKNYQKMKSGTLNSDRYSLSSQSRFQKQHFDPEKDLDKNGNNPNLNKIHSLKYQSPELIETPEKVIQRIDYSDPSYCSLFTKEGIEGSPQRRVSDQTTEEIIRELRARYGSQKKGREARKDLNNEMKSIFKVHGEEEEKKPQITTEVPQNNSKIEAT